MGPDEAKALAKEFDFAGEILCLPIANAAGVGPGRMLIVRHRETSRAWAGARRSICANCSLTCLLNRNRLFPPSR